MIPRPGRCGGISYIEVLVAVALLAVCALPAAEAVWHGLRAGTVAEAKARELRCLKNRMETVLAEPYDSLWTEVRGNTVPSSYSQPADPDGSCDARNVFISKYVHGFGTVTGTILDAGAVQEDTLLLVRVSTPEGSYSLTTLADR